MTIVENAGAQVEDPEGGSLPEVPAGDGGLVLPEDVVARLAEQLAGQARAGGPVRLTGPGGLLAGIIGQVLQAGMAAELGAHLENGGAEDGNRRNGTSAKTLNTEVGPVRLAVPRDRAGTFDPVLVPRQVTRSDGLNAVIISLYAKGMSVRDIARHVRQTTGVELTHDTVSRVTDTALEAMREWQYRPLEPFYPVIYIDALVAKVRDGAAVRNKALNIAVGIDTDGAKHVLGIWVAPAEGAKTWAQALAQLRNRGLEEVLFVCCDGLSGLGDEITATWPATTVQTCVVHLIRRSLNFASYTDRKAVAQALRPVYSACDADAAEAAFLEFSGSALGKKYPAAVAVWERAWDRFIPFLEFGPSIRKVLYTTNAVESFNREMRKVLKTRTQFPNDDSVTKTLWLAIVDTEEKRAEQRARQAGKPKNQRDGAPRLIEGHVTQGWHEAWGDMVSNWPQRFAGRILR
ncbi:MAG TPA: IS256 family transposase [Trebonia sp.]